MGLRLAQEQPAFRLPRERQPFVAFVLLGLLYFVGAKVGIHMTIMPEGTAVLWIPNAAVLAALLIFRGHHYPQFVLIAVAAEVAASAPVFQIEESLLFGLVNVCEATFAFLLLRRYGFDPRFRTLDDTLKFVVAGPVVSALAAALGGALIYTTFRGGQTSYLEFARIWWFGDGLGLLIFTPLFLALWYEPNRNEPTRLILRRTDVVAAVLTAIAIALMGVSRNSNLLGMHVGPIILVPLVAYAAARFDLRIASSVVATAALAVAALLTGGRQIFGKLPPREAVIQAQEYIFIMSVVALGLYALVSQLHAKQRELDALNRNLEALVRDRTEELSKANEQLVQLALTDPLTGLFNRRAFLDSARRELGVARRHGREVALMIIDLDHFKAVNDRYGHRAGDVVLKKFVDTFNKMIRAGDTFSRYGGEEFVVLAPQSTQEGAIGLANRMLSALRAQTISFEGGETRITASIGVTMVDEGDKDLDAALKRADEALYAAKGAGRDRVVAIAPPPARTAAPGPRS
jgi:diguanylate cyclase (GGDEF)-like protein